jgi:hypothetical protein
MRWNKRSFSSSGVTEYPTGPNLYRLDPRRIFVTRPSYDNIGEILESMNIKFEPFTGEFDCAILFVNCGTPDKIQPDELAEFVRNGGCVYGSDLADSLFERAFPGLIQFRSSGGGQVEATVVDPELRAILGKKISIDRSGSVRGVGGGEADVILEVGKSGSAEPIMVYAEFGKGAVFYTSFHNRSQASRDEKRLLQLLVLKQISIATRSSLQQISQNLAAVIPGSAGPA